MCGNRMWMHHVPFAQSCIPMRSAAAKAGSCHHVEHLDESTSSRGTVKPCPTSPVQRGPVTEQAATANFGARLSPSPPPPPPPPVRTSPYHLSVEVDTATASSNRPADQDTPFFRQLLRGPRHISANCKQSSITLDLTLDSPSITNQRPQAHSMSFNAVHPKLRELVLGKWIASDAPRHPEDTLIFRGLRVRMGFHSGLVDEADIVFNNASGRYVYTGAFRRAANAVAGFGKGGHILMSTSTAARFGLDSSGVLRSLPADIGVYYMGTHWSHDNLDEPVPLLLALPKALSCRLALMDHTLRSLECVDLGCLSAPCSGLSPNQGIVLVGMQIGGLSTLMTWDKAATQEAVRQCLQRVRREINRLHGVLSEDGASLAVADNIITHFGAADKLKSGLGRHELVPGRVVAAFTDPSDALQFAVSVRLRLLTHPWPQELLTHPLCERIASVSDIAELVVMPQQRQVLDTVVAGPSSSNSSATVTCSLSHGMSRQNLLDSHDAPPIPRTLVLDPSLTLDDVFISDSHMLAGLRIRFGMVCGHVDARIATRSTGRAVYGGNKVLRRLHKMLQHASPGQLLVDGKIARSIAP